MDEIGYDDDLGESDRPTTGLHAAIGSSAKKESAMSRLVTSTQYKTEFFIARTTFDLGLITLLLAVAVRTTAMFDESISGPVAVLLGGTALLLLFAALESYWTVVRPLEQQQQKRDWIKKKQKQPALRSGNGFGSFILGTTALVSLIYYVFQTQIVENVAEKASTIINPPSSTKTMRQEVRATLDLYSKEAGESKLKTVLEKVAAEKEGTKSLSPGSASKNSKGTGKSKGKEKVGAPSQPLPSPSPSSSMSAEDGKKTSSEIPTASEKEKEAAGTEKSTAAESSPIPSNAEVK